MRVVRRETGGSRRELEEQSRGAMPACRPMPPRAKPLRPRHCLSVYESISSRDTEDRRKGKSVPEQGTTTVPEDGL